MQAYVDPLIREVLAQVQTRMERRRVEWSAAVAEAPRVSACGCGGGSKPSIPKAPAGKTPAGTGTSSTASVDRAELDALAAFRATSGRHSAQQSPPQHLRVERQERRDEALTTLLEARARIAEAEADRTERQPPQKSAAAMATGRDYSVGGRKSGLYVGGILVTPF
jgi:hypothetical protein